jgi:hypothetical protein
MKKLRIYLDTSVINFLFADDAPDFKKATVEFFDQYATGYELYVSEIVRLEIQHPQRGTSSEIAECIGAASDYHVGN